MDALSEVSPRALAAFLDDYEPLEEGLLGPIGSPVGVLVSQEELDLSVCAASPLASPVVIATASAAHPLKKPRSYNPNRAREEQRKELAGLREQVPRLEQVLGKLKWRSRRNKRAGTTPRTLAATSDVDAWREVAACRRELREQAELENAWLRAVVGRQLEIAKRMQQLLQTRYSYQGMPGRATLDASASDSAIFVRRRDRLRWGAQTRAGNDLLRCHKENQDCFCACDALAGDEDAALFAVLDGHGPQGAFVSHFLRTQYHAALADAYAGLGARRAATLSVDTASEMFARAASAMSERLAASGIDTSVSGSTAVAMLVRGDDVFIANVGDSRAVVAVLGDGPEQRYEVHSESLDHKPDVPEERARIEASSGRVFEWGSFRVWLQDVDMPGLGMSRSFGDAVAKTVGVTSDPDVIAVDALPRSSGGKQSHPGAFAVLASDGVWEFFSSDECVEFVSDRILQDGLSAQQACDALIEEAFERWNSEEDVVDDITVTLVFF